MSKIIYISGCNQCPYRNSETLINHDIHETINNNTCLGIGEEDVGWNQDLSDYIQSDSTPQWCPLEDYLENPDEIKELVFRSES